MTRGTRAERIWSQLLANFFIYSIQMEKGKGMKAYNPRNTKRMSFAEDLIENLPIGLMILDQDGKVLRMNKKQEETSQTSRNKILGKTFAETFPRTLEQGLKKHYFNLLKKGIPFNFVIDRYIPQYNIQQMTYRALGSPFLLWPIFHPDPRT